jgi:hypothetical protein
MRSCASEYLDPASCIAGVLAELLADEFYRLEPQLRVALQDVMRQLEPDYATMEGERLREFYVAFFNTGAPKK